MKKHFKKVALGALVLGSIGTALAFTPRKTNGDMVQVKIIKEVDGIVTIKDTVLKDSGELKLHEILVACNVVSDHKMHNELLERLHKEHPGKKVMVIEHTDDAKDIKWEEKHKEIRIEKEVDDKGNVKILRTIDGKTEEISEDELEKMHKELMKKHHHAEGKSGEEHEMKVEVRVDKDVTEDIHIKGDEQKIVVQKKVVVEEDGERSEHNEKVTIIITRDAHKLPANMTGVKKTIKDVQVDFYPNPTTGQFKLSFNLDSKDQTEIQIYDMNGKRVYHESIGDFKGSYSKDIDISGNGKGTYFLKISQGKNGVTKKVVVH